MEDYYFFKAIRKTIIQFLDIFNDIKIERYDVNGTVKGQYKVPIRYGPKSKAFLWVRDRGRDEEMLPMISIYITGIDFDSTRLTNRWQDILVSDTNSLIGTYAKNAAPYNISFTVNIWALHMVDIDQIYEQILPYFVPHAFIKVKLQELDIAYDVKVILNGCSPVMTDDVGEEEARVLKWDTNFVAQTWLFKPTLAAKKLIGSFGTSGVIGSTPAWAIGRSYKAGDVLYHNGVLYQAQIDHIAAADNEPGVGINWGTYWDLIEGTSGYAWTSGMGTTGLSSDDSTGKVVTRYYTDPDVFEDRDIPEMEIYEDSRPVETVTMRIVGVDEDAKIIIDYESFGENI